MIHIVFAHLFTLLLWCLQRGSGFFQACGNKLSKAANLCWRARGGVNRLEHRVREWRRIRRDRAVERVPRIWCLVGGTCTNFHPDYYLQKRIPALWPAVHSHRRYVTQADEGPNCIIRYFVGKKPIAEAVPDPEGGWRIFTKEESIHA